MANKGKRGGHKSQSEKNRRQHYINTNKREENKIRKIKRHIKKLPNDAQAKQVLETLI